MSIYSAPDESDLRGPQTWPVSRDSVFIAAVFSAFIVVRVIGLASLGWVHYPPVSFFPDYVDGYIHYQPAGVAYLRGVPIDDLNPEHPPLAKYIIGLFALSLGKGVFASLLFNFLSAFLVFLLARKLTGSTAWATIAVWLLGFDLIYVGIAISPMLESFMLFFALLGIYLISVARNAWSYTLAGLSLGLGIASKWPAFFFLLPALAFLVIEGKPRAALILVSTCILGYVMPYFPYVIEDGFGAFLRLQLWMLTFQYGFHGRNSIGGFVSALLAPFIFHASTYGLVAFLGIGVHSMNNVFHPEGFIFLGGEYVSLAADTTPFVMLLFFPALYVEVKRYRIDHDRLRLLLLLVFVGCLGWEALGAQFIFPWHLAVIVPVLAIFASDIFKRLGPHKGLGVYVYLGLVASWPIWAALLSAFSWINFLTH